MKRAYQKPQIKIITFHTEQLMYSTSIIQGGDDDGTLPIDAKPYIPEWDGIVQESTWEVYENLWEILE